MWTCKFTAIWIRFTINWRGGLQTDLLFPSVSSVVKRYGSELKAEGLNWVWGERRWTDEIKLLQKLRNGS